MQMFLLLLGLSTIALSTQLEWEEYKVKFNKQYKSMSDELHHRMSFLKTVKEIAVHNELFDKGLSSFQMGINQFSDYTREEFAAQYLSSIRPTFDDKPVHRYVFTGAPVPESLDYRTLGAVGPVKDQGRYCKSAWAFSVTGSLEGITALKRNQTLVTLSEQQLIDCVPEPYSVGGCTDGFPSDSFKYIMKAGGINGDDTYPYESGNGRDNFPCRYNPTKNQASVRGYRYVKSNESALVEALVTQGPLAVSVRANDYWRTYDGGVMTVIDCPNGINLNHDVTLVGYGQNTDGKSYYIIKNSWNHTWGEHGYARLEMYTNTCSIRYRAMYPYLFR